MPFSHSDLLLALCRATVVLSVSAGIAWAMVRCLRPASARLQQIVWLFVLLQGIVLLRIPVDIPWYRAAMETVTSPDSDLPRSAAPIAQLTIDPPTVATSAGRPGRVLISWHAALFGIWLTGCGVTMAWWAAGYFGIARRNATSLPPREDWAAEWQSLLEQHRVTTPLSLRITEETGPVLLWLPGSTQVLVPQSLWSRLSAPQRQAILRHELAHFRHGDCWKRALVRLLALPHWFNPLAWWVVRNLDECAEWLCDDEATGFDPCLARVYAEVLLQLGTNPRTSGISAMAMRGGRLHGRIRRVLAGETHRWSLVKRLSVAAVPLALLCGNLIQVQLVADPATPRGAAVAASSTKERDLPAPRVNVEEERVHNVLTNPGEVSFDKMGLEDAMRYLSAYLDTSIRFDEAAMNAAKIPLDSPVTLDATRVTFQRILNLVLTPLDLEWHVEGPGIVVTTHEASAALIRRRLEPLLDFECKLIDSICELTDAQSKNLEVAGRGDIARLPEAVKECSLEYQRVRGDEGKVAELFVKLEQLQTRIYAGPFGNGSLFRKTLETLLTAEQTIKYEPIRTVLQAGGRVGTRQRGSQVLLGVLLYNVAFNDAQMAGLRNLTAPSWLMLHGTEITDVGLSHVKELTNLQELFIGGTRVTDAGVAQLKQLKTLRALTLWNTQVTDFGLGHLKGLTDLEQLGLGKTRISDVGLIQLKGLTQLRSLSLDQTEISDDGLIHLQGLSSIESLGLGSTSVTDAGLVHLIALTNLHTLYLSRTRITDAGLLHLAKLSKLQELFIGGTQTSDAGVATLQQALPNTKLWR